MSQDEDEPLTLSAETSKALQDFYLERDDRQRQFEDLKARAEAGEKAPEISIDAFTEDWNASQFWYDESTATTLAEQLLDGTNNDSCIAVVSAPSVFVKLKNMVESLETSAKPEIYLFEYDRRFDVFPEFVPYDFNQPLRLPGPKNSGAYGSVVIEIRPDIFAYHHLHGRDDDGIGDKTASNCRGESNGLST